MEDLRRAVQQSIAIQLDQVGLELELMGVLSTAIHLLREALSDSGSLKSTITSVTLQQLETRNARLRDKFSRVESGLVSLQHELVKETQ